jgi:hypothetical protein
VQLDLIDHAGRAWPLLLLMRCHLFTRTALVGAGKPSLPSDLRADIELLDHRRLGNGVVYLRYRIPI